MVRCRTPSSGRGHEHRWAAGGGQRLAAGSRRWAGCGYPRDGWSDGAAVTGRQAIRSSAVWTAADVADAAGWRFDFSESERAALVDAAQRAVATGRTVTTLRPEDFDLPELRARVTQWIEAIDRGQGFVLLSRFPIDLLTPETTELAYVGLGLQLGTPVGQDADATLLGHIRDEGVDRSGPSIRFYRTNQRQDFHTDGADIVGLLCLEKAKSGGESRIASSHAVYNEILRRRPDLTEVLYEPFPWDRNDEQSAGEDPYFMLPVFHDVGGTPRIFFIGWYIRDSQRHPQAPRLTVPQLEALALIESIANDPTFHLEMEFEPGDIQLISNAKILHSREAFEDHPGSDRRRHLLRLWLAARTFTSVDDVLRGGIPQRR